MTPARSSVQTRQCAGDDKDSRRVGDQFGMERDQFLHKIFAAGSDRRIALRAAAGSTVYMTVRDKNVLRLWLKG